MENSLNELKRNSIHQKAKLKINDKSSPKHHICTAVAMRKNFKYYLQNSTLHCLKYIAKDEITIPERIFFGLSFVLVVILSAFLIMNVYGKWCNSPIIITTSAKPTLSTEIPFPAITICNLNLAQKSKVHYTISRSTFNYSLLMSLCGHKTEYWRIGTWKDYKNVLVEVAQPCNAMLLYCSFGSQVEDCSKLFNTVLTDEGLCCTFNALDSQYLIQNYSKENDLLPPIKNHFEPIDWAPERGYPKNLPPHYFPRVSGGTGARMGLTVILNVSSDEYYCTKTKCIGFKILVHNPAELPKISSYGFLMTAGSEARIPIEPIYQDAVPSIRSIKKSVRKCLFSDEGDLIYYRTYSRKNCELECEAKILRQRCSCVLYYLPHIDPSVRVCDPTDSICTNQVLSEIESSKKNSSCGNCLPGCFELNYQTSLTASSIVYGDFLSSDVFPAKIFNNSKKPMDISIMHFYYTSNMYRSTTKSELYDFTDFLSNMGGLLGLFMGFSLFSLIEIVYYITVRPYCAARTLEMQQEDIRLKASYKTSDNVLD